MPEPSTPSDPFVPLPPSDQSPQGQVGCLLWLAGFLVLLGGGIIAVFIVNPTGKGDVWVMPLVGGAFALVGLLLLYAGIRGARGLRIAPVEVSIERRVRLVPGATVRTRLRQPGPMTIESLKLKATCEREYRRKVKEDSSSTVEDCELIWEQVLLEVRDRRVSAGDVLECEVDLTLPPGAQPTGRAQPDGRIRWRLEVFGEAGFLRATHRAFDIQVQQAPGDASVVSPLPAGQVDVPKSPDEDVAEATGADVPRVRATQAKPGGPFHAGCLVFAAGFLLSGGVFLWAFFSGAAFSGRGNPYMALVGGLLFSGFGLVALVVGVLTFLPAPAAKRSRRRRSP
jgi:hypothetical protein